MSFQQRPGAAVVRYQQYWGTCGDRNKAVLSSVQFSVSDCSEVQSGVHLIQVTDRNGVVLTCAQQHSSVTTTCGARGTSNQASFRCTPNQSELPSCMQLLQLGSRRSATVSTTARVMQPSSYRCTTGRTHVFQWKLAVRNHAQQSSHVALHVSVLAL